MTEFADQKDRHFSAVIPRHRVETPPLTPAQIDRLADRELAAGHHLAAENLSHLAAEMRERV